MTGPGHAGCRALCRLTLSLAGCSAVACTGESATAPLSLPVVETSAASGVPHNVLAARVTVSVRHADSVAVRFGPAGAPLDSVTPASIPTSDSATMELPVLGLLPSTPYALQAVAWGGGQSSTGDTLALFTATLPAALPAFTAGGPDPLPGFVAFSRDSFAIIVDNTGRIVWYRALPGGLTLNFQPQPTGHYYTSPTNAAPGDLQPWIEFDVLGDVVRRFGCAEGLRSRFHDILAEADGGLWLLCDETRTMDLTAFGGAPSAAVTATVVQHIGADGTERFRWNAFDHFSIDDLEPALRTGANVNFTHGNAFDFDASGYLLVSFRSLSEVTAIDTSTGAIAWRMGGRANQFVFDEAGEPFARQHGLRVDGAGHLVLLDNLGQVCSRAERFRFRADRTAARTSSMGGMPPVTALLGGAVQRLNGGRILVAYGNADRVQEYDAPGSVAWEIHGDPGYIYRATRIASLYRPGLELLR